jgi:hypothetical protein
LGESFAFTALDLSDDVIQRQCGIMVFVVAHSRTRGSEQSIRQQSNSLASVKHTPFGEMLRDPDQMMSAL